MAAKTYENGLYLSKFFCKIYKNGKKEDWGWNFNGSKYVPIMTDIKPASEEVLKIILCNCKSSCKTTRRTCRKYGIFCSSISRIGALEIIATMLTCLIRSTKKI